MKDLPWIVLIIVGGWLLIRGFHRPGRVRRGRNGDVVVRPPIGRAVAQVVLGTLVAGLLGLIGLLGVSEGLPWWAGAVLGLAGLYGLHMGLTGVVEQLRARVVVTPTTLEVTPAWGHRVILPLRTVRGGAVETSTISSGNDTTERWEGWKVIGLDEAGREASVLVPRWVPPEVLPWLPARPASLR